MNRTRTTDESGITRRRFLTGLGVAGTTAVAAGYGLSIWADGGASSPVTTSTSVPTIGSGRTDRTLVVVELAGGNDGLNTVVPITDSAYRVLRPTLGVTDAIAIDDGSIGLHPALPRLAERYRAGHVAIVEGVGSEEPNLSHFASLATWWSGDPGSNRDTGWLGRYLDATVGDGDPLAAVGIGPVPSPALLGARSFVTTIADATGLQPTMPSWVDTREDLVAAWSRFTPASPDPTTALGEIQRAIALTAEARDELTTELRSPPTSNRSDADAYFSDASATTSLALAAQLVASDRAPRVIYVNGLGDYDTHQGEIQRHPALMADLDAGLESFFRALEAGGMSERAIVMTVSEFGRRPEENGSGTDHGTAAPHFVVGAPVKGGRYGTPPSLTQLDEHGNLTSTTDFRRLYATAVQDWLGVDAEPVLGAPLMPLPLLA